MRYDRLLEGKTVLITGGGGAIASAFARLFTQHGANVVLDYEAYIGPPDAWVHAADDYRPAYIDEMGTDDLKSMMDVSAVSPYAAACAFAVSRAGRGGSIVFVASQYGVQAMNRVSGYGAAKGAEIALAKALAEEMAPCGIRVNALVPGVSIGPVGEDILRQSGDKDTPDFWGTVQPFRRRGTPEELADAALFLLSDFSLGVSGEALYVDGAQHLIAHNHYFPREDKVLP